MKKHLCALLAVAAASVLVTSAHAHEREGFQLFTGAEQWKWVEQDSSGKQLLSETGPVAQLGGRFTYSTHGDTVFHTITAKTSRGTINYDGAYIDGPALQTKTRYDTLSIEYAVAGPLTSNLEWTASLGAEERNRAIANPSTGKNQVENYHSAIVRAGVQVPRPAVWGLYGSVGVNTGISTMENIHATDMGFTTSPLLHPKADIGGYLNVGYAVSRNFSVEFNHELLRFRESSHQVVKDAKGASYEIWQPRSILNRSTVQAVYRF